MNGSAQPTARRSRRFGLGARLTSTPDVATDRDPLRTYSLQKVRIGIHATLVILVVVGAMMFLFAPDIASIPLRTSLPLLFAGLLGVATITVVPWDRLVGTKLGSWCFHLWSVLDVLLITLAIGVTGGVSSELFFLYALTTTVFAISYTPRVQMAFLAFTSAAYTSVLIAGGWAPVAGTLVPRIVVLAALALLGNFVSSELLRLLRSQTEVARQLQELDDLRGDFLSTVQHELRTPLAAIKGFAQTLSTHWTKMHDDLRDDIFNRISNNAKELDGLIAQLLDFSLAERGQFTIDPRPCDLREVVDETVSRLDGLFKGREIAVEIPSGPIAIADAMCCARIVENLLTNAVKFSPDGSQVAVWAYAGTDELVVAVQDEGIGVAPEEAKRIFERFYRVDRGTSSNNGGTGIGLAVVKQLVEAQGGRVWVESAMGVGSAFMFTLPLAPKAAARQPRAPRVSPAGPQRNIGLLPA